MEACRVTPFSAELGAEITGVDITQMSDGVFRRLLNAWHKHGVIVVRDQDLTMADLVAYSVRFGTPVRAAPQERALLAAQAEEVMIVSNIVEDGKPLGHLGSGSAAWHSDMCYTTDPPIASVMYAVELPPTGGNTGFMNMYRVYDSLPASLKNKIAGLTIKHDRSYTAVGDLRYGYEPVTDVAASPGAVHPIIRRHPVTGRNALFLGRRLNAYVVGLGVAESESLINELWRYTEQPDVTWFHRWRVGDTIIWDNRCLMHCREAFDPQARRLMWRTQIRADKALAC